MTTLTATQASQLFREAPQDYIDVGAGEVAYRRVGSGPDVLFIHGWPVSGATYRRLLPHLAPHVTCHIVDLLGAGQSRFEAGMTLDVNTHIDAIPKIVDALGLESFAAVGHDSGGMFARHALAGHPRLRAMALLNTEQPQGLAWYFKQFLMFRYVPGYRSILPWLVNRPGLRKLELVLGGCFVDKSLIGGEFHEFFLEPLREHADRRWAAGELLKNFDTRFIHELGEVHARIDVPVQLVWADRDPFFPLDWAREMVDTFPNAAIRVIEDAKLFLHEERPEQVASAMLSTLLRSQLSESV